MSHTTTITLDLEWNLEDTLRAGRVYATDREALLYGIARGLLTRAGVNYNYLTGPNPSRPGGPLDRLLTRSGARRAWKADQKARSVPVECPDWCEAQHLTLDDEKATRIEPWTDAETHEAELASSPYLMVYLVRDQAHPDSSEATTREYVSVYPVDDGDPLDEIAPDDFADVAAKITETLALTSVRLAAIREEGAA